MEKSVIEIIERTPVDDVKALKKYLSLEEFAGASDIEKALTDAADHSLNLFGDAPDYAQIVRIVAAKVKVRNDGSMSIEETENEIIKKLFEDAWERMDQNERREFLQSLDVEGFEDFIGLDPTEILKILVPISSGFYLAPLAMLLANLFGRALAGVVVGDILLARALPAFLGPVGWIGAAIWTAYQLGGPAYRKIVPAVVHIAFLRKMVDYTLNIGIVGDVSAGKDAAIKGIFGIDTGSVNPIAGSTQKCEAYSLKILKQGVHDDCVKILNYPGFNDPNGRDPATASQLIRTDVFVHVVDISRGITGTDIEVLDKLKSFDRPVIVCLNKVDLVRSKDLENLTKTARQRLKNGDIVECAFDPLPQLAEHFKSRGVHEVRDWIGRQVNVAGKGTVAWEEIKKLFLTMK